jgi:hypothetical protein
LSKIIAVIHLSVNAKQEVVREIDMDYELKFSLIVVAIAFTVFIGYGIIAIA